MGWKPPAYTDEEIVAELRLKAAYWRQEAKRFAGRREEQWCTEYAQHAETLADLVHLSSLDHANV